MSTPMKPFAGLTAETLSLLFCAEPHERAPESNNNTEEKLPCVLFDATEMADVPAWLSVWLSRKLLKLGPIWIRIHMDVWPSAKACRVQSEIFGIFLIRKVGVMIGAADSMLWVTRSRTSQTFRSDTHTQICSGVEGGCGAACENCAWGAESWASTIQQIRHGWTQDARRAHDPSWQILQQMRFTDFLICVCGRD